MSFVCWMITFLVWISLIYGVICCDNQNLQELINTSPVILKALGAKIFADTNAYDIIVTEDTILRYSSSSSSSLSWPLPSSPSSTSATLITLTPETLYKGASILKVAQTDGGSIGSGIGGELYEYEGQLNATLEPLGCFDNDILTLLPTELIAFGKLDSDQSDILRVNINGLYKWSTEFEGRIWKHLGWDDWSDFTPCSVTCGKGVQQRFRRCVLDNPNRNTNSDSIRSSHSRSTTLNQFFDDVEDQEGFYYHSGLKINDKIINQNHKKYKTTSKMMKKRRKKKGKVLETLSCEGYNIEQRNCNMFECRDDISDLLKFYKNSIWVNETTSTFGTTTTMTTPSISSGMSGIQTVGETTTPIASATTTVGSESGPTGVPSTGGIFLRSWKNPMNFTLMTTLRAKNKSQSTIFSLRNDTHNLYLDQYEDGLKIFQERDDVTEMLPIKLDLYDNRWHQIAISIQNGDFITIFVDCLWTNSFVVSKRLFSLPERSDIEIGRNFNGELQQLLILPGHNEKLQCSTFRTPINEVKRYIIDTFIDDYGN